MSLHKAKDRLSNEGLDSLIRWALHDSVVDAEPSSEVWTHIQRNIVQERQEIAGSRPDRRRTTPPRLWFGWLMGAGAEYPVPGDPRFAWQGRLHAFDMRAPLSVLRIVEGKLPALRLVS